MLEPLESRILLSAGVVPRQMANDFQMVRPGNAGVVIGLSLSDSSGVYLTRLRNDGALDLSFGKEGRVIVGGVGPLDELQVQPDGRIIALSGGRHGRLAYLMRFDADGSLDSTFGEDGFVAVPYSTASEWGDVALMGDGRIVVAEAMEGSPSIGDVSISRFMADGGLDSSFGDSGTAQIDCPAAVGGVRDLRAGANGELSLVGIGSSLWMIALNSTGAPDQNVGSNGVLRIGKSGWEDIYLLRDGSAVSIEENPTDDGGMMVSHLLPNGAPDLAFGQSGKAIAGMYGWSLVASPPVELVDGRMIFPSWTDTAQLISVNRNGMVDRGFGGGAGFIDIPTPANYSAEMVDAGSDGTGRVLTATFIHATPGLGKDALEVTRFRRDGSVDTSFGRGGNTILDVETINGPTADLLPKLPFWTVPQPTQNTPTTSEDADDGEVIVDTSAPPRSSFFAAERDTSLSLLFAVDGLDRSVLTAEREDLFS